MQAAPRAPGQPASVKIYNAVYSSVQVYECMVRGIAVMRRRADSYVNATQILKVAGVDKGRRTKILEKEILPGKHEIVQGGYGKYQGTWVPLERGRELALQYGIAPLLSPLFDFVPNTAAMNTLPNPLPMAAMTPQLTSPRPLTASASYPVIGTMPTTVSPGQFSPHNLGPAPILPGSAMRLLSQGRAQGLFTPTTSALLARHPGAPSPGYYPGLPPGPYSQPASPGPSTNQALKRNWTDADLDNHSLSNGHPPYPPPPPSSQPMASLAASPDITMTDMTRPSSAPHPGRQPNGDNNPSPSKRLRVGESPSNSQSSVQPSAPVPTRPASRAINASPSQAANGNSRLGNVVSSSTPLHSHPSSNGSLDTSSTRPVQLASKPTAPRLGNRAAPLKNTQRSAVMAAICQGDNATTVLELLREASSSSQEIGAHDPSSQLDANLILDDLGHSPLHLAASLSRLKTAEALIANGADVHRGNYQGETPLIRATLSTHCYDAQSFHDILLLLHPSIRTIDTAKRSVLHHIACLAGIKGRASHARYYLEGLLTWVVQREGSDFKNVVDLQDEHGDTALNIAARVGNRSLVRSLLDAGANRILPNKLGLRPGDFGVEPEELDGGPRVDDILSSLRAGPSLPIQKSQDVAADLTSMIHKLSSDFTQEIKVKQDQLDVTQAHLRAATRELADQRRQISLCQARCGELDQVMQRTRNLQQALSDEDAFDWAYDRPPVMKTEEGMTPIHAKPLPGGALAEEPSIPSENTLADLIKLRRMLLWQNRVERLMAERLKGLRGASAVKEFQCKKIVALCAGVPLDKVEDMLDNLVIAMESDTQMADIGRVSGFMQKVRDGVI